MIELSDQPEIPRFLTVNELHRELLSYYGRAVRFRSFKVEVRRKETSGVAHLVSAAFIRDQVIKLKEITCYSFYAEDADLFELGELWLDLKEDKKMTRISSPMLAIYHIEVFQKDTRSWKLIHSGEKWQETIGQTE